MKKEIFKSIFKTYGILEYVFLSLIFGVLIFISFDTISMFDKIADLENLITGFSMIGLVLVPLVGFNGLKEKKTTGLDLIRVSLATGILVSLLFVFLQMIIDKNYISETLPYSTILKLIISLASLDLIVYQIYKREDYEPNYNVGVKNYFGQLFAKYNLLYILAAGLLIGCLGSFFINNNLLNYLNVINLLIGPVIVLIGIQMINKEITLIDYVSLVGLIALSIIISFAGGKLEAKYTIFFTVLEYIVILITYVKAITYSKEVLESSCKIKKYTSEVAQKYNLYVPLFVIISLITLSSLFVCNAPVLHYLFNTDSITNMSNFISNNLGIFTIVFVVIASGAVALLRGFKKNTISLLDYLTLLMLFIVILSLTYIPSSIVSGGNWLACAFIALAALGVGVLAYIRITNYDLEYAKDELSDDYAEEEIVLTEDTNEVVLENETVEEPVSNTELETIVEDLDAIVATETETVSEVPTTTLEVTETQEEVEEEIEDETEDEEDDENEIDLSDVDSIDITNADGTRERSILTPEIKVLDENGEAKKINRKFLTRMMFASVETKEYYNLVKNYLMMYRANSRYSSRCETFRYKGIMAKVVLAGKTVKVYLAISPKDLEGTKYHYKDMSEKSVYQEVPVLVKVSSNRGYKYFTELVDYMMAARQVKPKKNFVTTDYFPDLIPNGEAILNSIGLGTDYLYDHINIKSIPADIPMDLENIIPVISGTPVEEDAVEASIYIDTLCTYFDDNEVITLDILKARNVIKYGDLLRIKARGTLDKKLTIYADAFDAEALQMITCVNGRAIKIVR